MQVKIIEQLDLQGNLIKEWESITLATKEVGGYIQGVLSNRQKSAGGFKWRYKK